MSTTTLHLVRHAEPVPYEDDPALSSAGRGQADRLGQRFANFSLEAVLHSPQRRAAETAHLLATRLPGTAVACSALLRDVTPVPGQQDEPYPEWLHQRLRNVPADQRDLGGAGLRGAVSHFGEVRDGDQRELLLVTHAFVVGWFVRHALDAPTWRWAGLQPAPASVTVVRFSKGQPPMLLAFNDLAHL